MAPAKKPITYKNAVNPLTWNVPIVNKDGSPTEEFGRKWLQQAATNATIVNLTTAAGVSAVLDLITALAGSLLVRGTTRWQGLPSPADATMFLNGAVTPAYAKVKDTDLAVTDVVGNNVSIAAHGFAPKAPNDATKFLDGTGAYSTPPSGGTAAASIYDDGTNIYLALVDADEQLVLDGSGFGIYAPEVFPVGAIPQLGLAQMPPSTVIPCFSVQATANQTFAASGVAEKITLTSEIFDTTNNFASSRFTATVAGYYQIDAKFLADDTVSVASVIGWLYKNGAAYSEFIGSQFAGGGGGQTGILAEVVHLAVGDYVELWGQAAGTAPYARFVSAQLCNRLSGFLIVKD